jgi:hypothetical protein
MRLYLADAKVFAFPLTQLCVLSRASHQAEFSHRSMIQLAEMYACPLAHRGLAWQHF